MNDYEIEVRLKPRNAGRVHEALIYLARSTKNHVKSKVKGEVSCHIVNDTLVVDIYGANTMVFRYTRDNMYSEIVHGLTAEKVAEIIVKKYRSYINNLYFL